MEEYGQPRRVVHLGFIDAETEEFIPSRLDFSPAELVDDDLPTFLRRPERPAAVPLDVVTPAERLRGPMPRLSPDEPTWREFLDVVRLLGCGMAIGAMLVYAAIGLRS